MNRKSVPTRYEKQARKRILDLIAEYCDGSQQKLADKTDVGKASISQYVNGKNVPSNLTATKLAKPFGLNPAWIMGFDVPKTIPVDEIVSNQTILMPIENHLVTQYRKLNEEGKKKVIDYVDDLVDAWEGNIPNEPTCLSKELNQISEEKSYFLDASAAELAQQMYDRPELKMLFKTSKKVSAEDLMVVQGIVDALAKKQNGGG